MLTTKVLLNCVISPKGAQFMTINIKDFYLNTPMVCSEYMHLKMSDIWDHIIALYNLNKLTTTDGYVYVLIQKGMYSIPPQESCTTTTQETVSHQSYQQSTITPGFWKHD
eukprot:CCRYP_005779-RC/>CCRYP_005779-RC protein AED:0.45 eAED:0.45 QI:0/-1/0/1/-1/0/1/0/109